MRGIKSAVYLNETVYLAHLKFKYEFMVNTRRNPVCGGH